MSFNKTTLRSDIRRFMIEMTDNQYFLNGAFQLFTNTMRPTHTDCSNRNLFYCYNDGYNSVITSNNTNEATATVVIGILKSELEVMGVTQAVFDDTWSRLQANLSRDKMRVNWDGIPPVMGVSAPFTYGDLGILDIRNYANKTAQMSRNSLRYEMIVEIKFNFNQNL
jgi:hypothetical protein